MRNRGLDEYKVAEIFATVVEKLSGKKRGAGGGSEKLLVDVLKECSRHLDTPRTTERQASDAPTPITLVHCVARPVRPALSEGTTALSEVKLALKETL